ncbi:hypothetical protein FNH09_16325 [Streptomyces adustus]|uniref:Uncharacterized protein n=1 Tax=Streptomyces adustus TaxID=1609272 RepID=A0A5N8VCP6_9ACTN|nr:hypothetical protein [Streptomyces adustus]MPY32779.1 hypothetical protein [Streptomyces adustus]
MTETGLAFLKDAHRRNTLPCAPHRAGPTMNPDHDYTDPNHAGHSTAQPITQRMRNPLAWECELRSHPSPMRLRTPT